MFEQVNIAIQVLPQSNQATPYEIVDRAIELVQASGLSYQVCPFETVIEGPYDTIMVLLKEIQEECIKAGAFKIITNIKIEINAKGNVKIDDKMRKYK